MANTFAAQLADALENSWPAVAARTSAEVRDRVQELRVKLDPVHLLKEIRMLQQQLVDIADKPAFGETAKPTPPTLEHFLSGLRTAWRGERGSSGRDMLTLLAPVT